MIILNGMCRKRIHFDVKCKEEKLKGNRNQSKNMLHLKAEVSALFNLPDKSFLIAMLDQLHTNTVTESNSHSCTETWPQNQQAIPVCIQILCICWKIWTVIPSWPLRFWSVSATTSQGLEQTCEWRSQDYWIA